MTTAAPNNLKTKKRDSNTGDEHEIYNDVVTRETITTMNQDVPDETFEGYEIVEGPAW